MSEANPPAAAPTADVTRLTQVPVTRAGQGTAQDTRATGPLPEARTAASGTRSHPDQYWDVRRCAWVRCPGP